MGAVSGDINTLSFSVDTAADLSSRPTAALKSGDRAYVSSKSNTAEGPLFFIDKSSALPVDGTGVLATNSGVGRWLSEAIYGAVPPDVFIQFASIAALAAYDDSDLDDSTPVWVGSVRSVFRKRIEANPGTANGITIVRNPGNTATWYREGLAHLSWNTISVFFLNAETGNDESDGSTALTPLRTLEELTRRTVGAQPRGFFALNVQRSNVALTGTLEVNADKGVFINGEVVLGEAAEITAVTNFDRATNTAQRATFVGVVTPSDFTPMWETSSALFGWRTFQIAGNNYETKFFDSGSGQYLDPVVNDTVSQRLMPLIGDTVGGVVVVKGNGSIAFQNLNIANMGVVGFTTVSVTACGVLTLSAENCGFVECTISYIESAGVVDGNGTSRRSFQSCVIATSETVNSGTTMVLGSDTLINGDAGGTIEMPEGSHLAIDSSVEVRRTVGGAFAFSLIGPEATIDIQAAVPDYLYGNDNVDEILHLETNGCRVYYADINSLVAATAGNQWTRPGFGGLFAALPTVDATLFVGIVSRL